MLSWDEPTDDGKDSGPIAKICIFIRVSILCHPRQYIADQPVPSPASPQQSDFIDGGGRNQYVRFIQLPLENNDWHSLGLFMYLPSAMSIPYRCRCPLGIPTLTVS